MKVHYVWTSILVTAAVVAAETCGAEDKKPAPKDPGHVSVVLTGENAQDAFQVLSDATGFSIIASAGLASAKIFAAIVDMDAEQALKEIVEINGLHYVRKEKVVWILSDEEYFEDFNLGRERRVIPLSHAKADDIKVAVAEVLSKHAVAISYPETNVLVVSELTDRVGDLEKLILELDAAEETRVYEVKYAVAADLVFLLDPQMSRPGAIQADQRTNQIVARDTPANLEKIKTLIDSFDRPDTVSTRTYPLKYANAQDVCDVIQNMLYGGRNGGGAYGGMSATMRGNNQRPQGGGRQASGAGARPSSARSSTASRRSSGVGMYQQRQSMATGPSGIGANNQTAAPVSAGATASAAARGNAANGGPAAIPTAAPSAQTQPAAASQPPTQSSQAAVPANAPVQPGAPLPPGTTPPAASAYPGQQQQTTETGVGTLATVVAEPRTNSVIITHTTAMLERLEQMIKAIDVPTDLHVYQFQQVNPVDIDVSSKLQGLLSADGYVDVDLVSKKVVFRAPAEKAAEILQLLREWDIPSKQVRIEAEILSVNVQLFKELGITWEAVMEHIDNQVRYRTGDFLTRFPATVGDNGQQGSFRIGNIKTNNFSAVVQALASDTDTQVLASPKIIARDGQKADFASTRDEPYTVVTVGGATQTTMEDVRFLTIGVQMEITPIINNEGQIALDVAVENSTLAGRTDKGIPIVDRATAQSTVTVQHGDFLLLGGLRQRERSSTIGGLPGLKKLPLIGNLFRHSRRDRKEFEVILVLRPFIVNESHEAAPMASEIRNKLRKDFQNDSVDQTASPATDNAGNTDVEIKRTN